MPGGDDDDEDKEMKAFMYSIKKIVMAMEDVKQDMQSTVCALTISYNHIQTALLHYFSCVADHGHDDDSHGHDHHHHQREKKKFKMMKQADKAMVNKLTHLSHLIDTSYMTSMSQLHLLVSAFDPKTNPNPNPNPNLNPDTNPYPKHINTSDCNRNLSPEVKPINPNYPDTNDPCKPFNRTSKPYTKSSRPNPSPKLKPTDPHNPSGASKPSNSRVPFHDVQDDDVKTNYNIVT